LPSNERLPIILDSASSLEKKAEEKEKLAKVNNGIEAEIKINAFYMNSIKPK